MFERSKFGSLRNVSVTRIGDTGGDTLSYGFPLTVCRPSNMNSFTIFIQRNSLVDNHSAKYKHYIDMDD